MRSLLIFTFIFSILGTAWPEQEEKSQSEVVKEAFSHAKKAYKTYRAEKKQAHQLENLEATQEIDNGFCINCEQVLPLAKEINKIVREVALEEGLKNPKTKREFDRLPQEIGKLEVLYYVLRDSKNSEYDCQVSYLSQKATSTPPENLSPDELVFTKGIDLSKIKSLQYTSRNQRRIYYYRGWTETDNSFRGDTIFRVEVPEKGEATVSYYRLKTLDAKFIKKKTAKDYKLNIDKPSEDDDRNLSLFGEAKDSVLRGPSIDVNEDSLPQKVTLIQVSGDESQITDNLKMKTNVEVSSRKQYASFEFADSKGEEYATVTAKTRGMKLDVPTDFKVLRGVTSVEVGTDGKWEKSISLETLSNEPWRFGLHKSDHSKFQISHEKRVGEGTLSVEVFASDDDKVGNGGVVFFRMGF